MKKNEMKMLIEGLKLGNPSLTKEQLKEKVLEYSKAKKAEVLNEGIKMPGFDKMNQINHLISDICKEIEKSAMQSDDELSFYREWISKLEKQINDSLGKSARIARI